MCTYLIADKWGPLSSTEAFFLKQQPIIASHILYIFILRLSCKLSYSCDCQLKPNMRHAMLIKHTLVAMKKGKNQKGHMIHACLGHFFRNRYSKITKERALLKKTKHDVAKNISFRTYMQYYIFL